MAGYVNGLVGLDAGVPAIQALHEDQEAPTLTQSDTQIYVNGYTTLMINVDYEHEPCAEIKFQTDQDELQRIYQYDNLILPGNVYETRTVNIRFQHYIVKLKFFLRHNRPHLEIKIYDRLMTLGTYRHELIDTLNYPPDNA